MAIDTKEHILNAAERLIAEHGIDAVSLRSITSTAKVNLAAVHYHFGSKEALVRKVYERRVQPVNNQRLDMLNAVEAAAGDEPPAIEDVLRALIEPAIRLYSDAEKRPLFMRMCGRIYAEPAGYIQEIFDDLFGPMIRRFKAAFERALPDADPRDRAWAVQFSAGAMVHTMMESERLKRFSGGLCDLADPEPVIERMVQFCAGGIRAATQANSSAERAVVLSLEGD